jgi:hypothetical protein
LMRNFERRLERTARGQESWGLEEVLGDLDIRIPVQGEA